jgi:hypothetical protein
MFGEKWRIGESVATLTATSSGAAWISAVLANCPWEQETGVALPGWRGQCGVAAWHGRTAHQVRHWAFANASAAASKMKMRATVAITFSGYHSLGVGWWRRLGKITKMSANRGRILADSGRLYMEEQYS